MPSDITITADTDKIDPVAAVGFTSAPFEFDYTFKVNIFRTYLNLTHLKTRIAAIVAVWCPYILLCVYFSCYWFGDRT